MTKVYQRDDNIHVENINHIISEAIIGRTKDDTSSTIGSFSTKSAKTEELKRKVDEIIKNNIGDMLIETIIPKPDKPENDKVEGETKSKEKRKRK